MKRYSKNNFKKKEPVKEETTGPLFVTDSIRFGFGVKGFRKDLKKALQRFRTGDTGKTESYKNHCRTYIESVLSCFINPNKVLTVSIGTYPTSCGEVVIVRYTYPDKDKDIQEKTVVEFLEHIPMIEEESL